jgi:hypothetical protein
MAPTIDIDVFHGDVSPESAYVYARVNGIPGGQEWTVTGQVRGPVCQIAKTLPTTHSLTDLGAGESLLAGALVPDPCFWSPDLPALYRVTLEIRKQDSVIHTEERELGIRFLGTRRNSFYLENKRWVLRGVSAAALDSTPLSAWREASAAMVMHDPTDALCREASRAGVMLVAYVANPSMGVFSRLARWAAIGVIVTSSADEDLLSKSRRRFPNLLLAQFVEATSPVHLSQHCHAAFVDQVLLRSPSLDWVGRAMPIVAVRRLDLPLPLYEGRYACDELQRDLAPIGDFAGYVICYERFWH